MLKIKWRQSLLIATLLLCGGLTAQQKSESDSFLIDPNRPFLYLKFDHLGPSEPWSEDEPPMRLWFKLVNNCRNKIQILTFGGPDHALGIQAKVIPNQEGFRVTADATGELLESPYPDIAIPSNKESSQQPPSSTPPRLIEKTRKMPFGYAFEVGSSMEVLPGKQVLFSLPADFVGKKWHFEIPFKFIFPIGRCCQAEDEGGFPEMHLAYRLSDLPEATQKKIEKIAARP